MKLTEWAHAQGVHLTTANRWYREGVLPVPAWKAGRPILVSPGTAVGPSPQGGVDLYAQVSSHERDIRPQAVLTAGSTSCGGAG